MGIMDLNPIGSAVKGFMESVVSPILDKFIPDAKDRLEATLLIQKQVHELLMGQIEINKVEAASANVWVAGWRPAIGWTCASALAYIWIIRDWISWVMLVAGSTLPAPPMLMQDSILELTLGMLGMAGLRTYEKVATKQS